MSLAYDHRRAGRLLAALRPRERRELAAITARIRRAESRLSLAGGDLMTACRSRCRGLCCHNLIPGDIITYPDLVFILSVAETPPGLLAARAERESLFTGDCPFLLDGVGPCLFPPDAMPLKCIVTFCAETQPVRREIREVRAGFAALGRWLVLRKPKAVWRRLAGRRAAAPDE